MDSLKSNPSINQYQRKRKLTLKPCPSPDTLKGYWGKIAIFFFKGTLIGKQLQFAKISELNIQRR